MDINLDLNLNIDTDSYSEIKSNDIMYPDSEITIKKIYDHGKKIELVKKINKIKKKEYLLNIFKIISLYSKDYTENNNGVFVFFHNLDCEAYEQIEQYVNVIYKLHKKSTNILNIYNSEISDSVQFASDTIEIEHDKDLSNKEKMIMRRKKYEKYLNQNQENA